MAAPPIRRTVDVPMRDGIVLATDLYLPHYPENADGAQWPVILERTPYDKSGTSRSERSLTCPEPMNRSEVSEYFARRGYAVVVQDCRGRYASGGIFEKYVHEAADGYDTVAWLTQQEWCDGRIGMMGFSYSAHAQTAVAALSPPGLACMFIDSGGFSNAYQGGIRQGGAFEMKQATWALRHALQSPETAQNPARRERLEAVDMAEWMRNPTWVPGDSPLSAAPEYEAYFFEQWRRGLFDAYWTQPGLYAEGHYGSFPDIPVAIVGSWFDPYVRTCVRNFQGLQGSKTSTVRLVMGPWVHGDRSQTYAGDVDFGSKAPLDGNIADDYLSMRLSWFDTHLKGIANEAGQSSPVSYFCMGGGDGRRDDAGRLRHGGRWKTSATWPPSNHEQLVLYCHESGTLSNEAPTNVDAAIEYRFDPMDPVPTIGGAVTSGGDIMPGGAFDQVQTPETFAVRKISAERPLAERPDVLVFVSEPLGEALTIAGPVVAELWVSSDCPDTDFTIKLLDAYPKNLYLPEGYAMNLTDGIFRMRYRDGWEREARLEKDGIHMIRIEAFDTCNRFAKGHRIRVDISSSNYPHFDINPNTGNPVGDMRDPRVALNAVHCSSQYPSRVLFNVAA